MATWIFQANPEAFDVDAYLSRATVIRWTVRQRHLATEMEPGDRLFIWRAGGDKKSPSGVVAAGHLTSKAADEPEDPAAVGLWRDPPTGLALRVRAQIDKVADKKGVLKRDWLKDDPVLGSMRLLKFASETNYRLTPGEAARVEVLWQNTGRDWNEAESIAGLWAYSKTYGQEVSRSPDSPVSEVALRIGRAVTGVYNKVMNFRAIDPRDKRDGLTGGSVTDERVWSAYFDAASRRLDEVRLHADYETRWRPASAQSTATMVVAPTGSRPAAAGTVRGQGYEPDEAVRQAVEEHAMALAEEHYKGLGFSVAVTADTQPFDLRCTKDSSEVRVEVKGTRGDGSTIEVTIGEVNNARGSGWRTDLFVVSSIVVDKAAAPTATGGAVRIVTGWQPNDADLSPTRFRCAVPR